MLHVYWVVYILTEFSKVGFANVVYAFSLITADIVTLKDA